MKTFIVIFSLFFSFFSPQSLFAQKTIDANEQILLLDTLMNLTLDYRGQMMQMDIEPEKTILFFQDKDGNQQYLTYAFGSDSASLSKGVNARAFINQVFATEDIFLANGGFIHRTYRFIQHSDNNLSDIILVKADIEKQPSATSSIETKVQFQKINSPFGHFRDHIWNLRMIVFPLALSVSSLSEAETNMVIKWKNATSFRGFDVLEKDSSQSSKSQRVLMSIEKSTKK